MDGRQGIAGGCRADGVSLVGVKLGRGVNYAEAVARWAIAILLVRLRAQGAFRPRGGASPPEDIWASVKLGST